MNAAYPDEKTAQNSWLYKFAEQSLTKIYTETFADLDRYTTDLYDAVTSVAKHKFGISVGAQIYSTHIGVTSYCQYWHYKQDELSLADKTFEQIKEAIKSTKAEIEFNMLPMPAVMTIMRNKLACLDLEHRENPIIGNNRHLGEQYEPDWRSSLYGNRYPEPTLDTFESINSESDSAKIEVSGNSRDKTYRYRYAQHDPELSWKKERTYKGSDGGKYADYVLGTWSNGFLTVELDKRKGYRIRNIFVDKPLQRQGYATSIYKQLNDESMAQTGKGLRSSEIGFEKKTGPTSMTSDAQGVWDSFVNRGLAKQDGDHYQFTSPDAKSIPMVMNQPKYRSKTPPAPIRSFDTKQVEVFDKGASFRYAFENIDQVKAKQLLYRAVAEVGTSWKEIAKVLIHKYNVPQEMMSYLNTEYLQAMSKMAGRQRIYYEQGKYASSQ